MIWGNLLHLSYNMWSDRKRPRKAPARESAYFHTSLLFDENLWAELCGRMADAGLNMVVIDLGDGVRYESHPEITVSGAWTRARLRRELRKLRSAGLEPIPKLNFSACHDAWLGPYSRMVSTEVYYRVCKDLIAEVSDLFGRPRFFHLGMDEETPGHQRNFDYLVVRQGDLWWHDLLFYVKQVEHAGGRAWIWSDYVWDHAEDFFARMPRSVLQSNWYYDRSFSTKRSYVKAYLDLEAHGYDQIPTGSNWSVAENFERTVAFCTRHIAPKRLLGFLQAPWWPTIKKYRQIHLEAIDYVARARARLR